MPGSNGSLCWRVFSNALHGGACKGRTLARAAGAKVPWGTFLRSAPVWAIIVAHFCYNWGYYTLLAWLPSYFELSLGLTVEGSSLLTLIPYISMTAMTPFVGPVADALVTRGWSVTRVRKLAQVRQPAPNPKP